MNKQCVGLVGGGLMGTSIATQFALAGHKVLLRETSPARRAAIPRAIAGITRELLAAGAITGRDSNAIARRQTLVDNLADLADASLVIEAIPEVLAAKRELYRRLENVLAPDACWPATPAASCPTCSAAASPARSAF